MTFGIFERAIVLNIIAHGKHKGASSVAHFLEKRKLLDKAFDCLRGYVVQLRKQGLITKQGKYLMLTEQGKENLAVSTIIIESLWKTTYEQ